jgi:hypothetical protein
MTNLSKLLVVLGCLLLFAGIVVRITWLPIMVTGSPIQSISLVILANTSFILACLFKK